MTIKSGNTRFHSLTQAYAGKSAKLLSACWGATSRIGTYASAAALGLALTSCNSPSTPATQGTALQEQSYQGVALDKSSLETIQNATFEVVVKKPTKDSLKYEKPLPLELLPYAIRNDKYYSVGTAFAIAKNQFVTAAHVLNLGQETQFDGFSLRDHNGNIYPIDKVLKYSYRQDFVVFSSKNLDISKPFQANVQPRLNEKVYTVGNALGQGIVIRDGLYTSNTPEERDGAWKWIRYSAAASPGNSGGPLLDRDGKLIGIVQRKSENENLNYALPIGEVLNAKNDVGITDMQMLYRIENMPMSKSTIFRHEVKLPKSLSELNRELIQFNDKDGDRIMADMFKENQKKIFPNGSGSDRLLHSSTYSTVFPGMIGMGNDGIWDVYKANDIGKNELGANGYLNTGNLGGATYFHLRLPDKVGLREITRDSRQLMDLFLKGVNYTRQVGAEKVKVVSMGKANSESRFTDSYQRKWLVNTWLIEYEDEKLVMMALPVPDGLVGMLRVVDTGQLENYLRDMKALADFVYVAYYGDLAQWKAFLGMTDMLPAAFSNIQISFEPNKDFHYQSKRVAFSYPSNLMKVTNSSDLQLGFSYFMEGGKVVWDVSKIVVGEDKNTKSSFVVVRSTKPTREMGDNSRKMWDDMANKRHPFDQVSYFDDDQSIIGTVIAGTGTSSQALTNASLLYAILHTGDGIVQQQTLSSHLDGFIRSLSVLENTGLASQKEIGNTFAKQP
ncbi:MAG TPA: serine protease [Gallionellaceae bacterium]